ncbi:PAS domain-containing protein [Sulfidibacter corallicola]|uniref:histidine kinase n=1 Tax=Sulfidibacter corallicola TaxID=2818388 RepID=A0A8A4TN04_SULCO|nr:ATP-binding protein [Sulfidibacter corallicola]QTD47965.1 PAS domain-containing protein [Sulfidibacter corallicola]
MAPSEFDPMPEKTKIDLTEEMSEGKRSGLGDDAGSGEQDQDAELLLKAFQSFSEASVQLERSYQELQAHTRELDLELKETNEKLKRSLIDQEATSLHLRGILGALQVGILVIDLDGTLVEINPSAAKLLQVDGKSGVHYARLDLPEPVNDFVYHCLDSTMPRRPRQEVSIPGEDGQIDLELTFRLVRPEGGGIMSVLILIEDKTLLNRLQSQSKRTARLAAMGEMAAELAHEIRNPLGSIKLFSGLLESDLEAMPDQAKLAYQISHGVTVLENIVSNILAYSANVTPKLESIDLAVLIDESLSLFELERDRKEIQLEVTPPQKPARIMGDPHLLKQVVLNLCNNAIKAMKKGGRLEIHIKRREEYADLVITDSGHGIPAGELHKIFDPFFTTFRGGTGLGLSVVNQIVEKHRGAIDVKSVVGEGTSVYVSLPRIT